MPKQPWDDVTDAELIMYAEQHGAADSNDETLVLLVAGSAENRDACKKAKWEDGKCAR